MTMDVDIKQIDAVLDRLRSRLLAARCPEGYWEGKLSASALATATAVFALWSADRGKYADTITAGRNWLAKHRNADGGWGDTPVSVSNISATLLSWAALSAGGNGDHAEALDQAQVWITNRAGSLEPAAVAKALDAKYGRDKTFSVPILTMCVLADVFGDEAWKFIRPLPFELAVLPHRLFKWLRLSVVSYAMPALVAVGQVKFYHDKPHNPFVRMLRSLSRQRALKILRNIQPESGGFLEAVPLTSFVVMSLVGAGEENSEVVRAGTEFITASVRADGSWPIDTHLATWVTSLSVDALAAGEDFDNTLSADDRQRLKRWLLKQQYHVEHPYTHAEPGGWSWTPLSGGVPDADDTAGALLALRKLDAQDADVIEAAKAGIHWLMNLQNTDGGMPTFCRGWNKLPFDRSAPDLTAHAIGAISAWLDDLPGELRSKCARAIEKAMTYLERCQRADGAWIPLWFGNEFAPDKENATYGTGRVVSHLSRLPAENLSAHAGMLTKAVGYLLDGQNADGGWGGGGQAASSIEETAVATDAIASAIACRQTIASKQTEEIERSIDRASEWLIEQIGDGTGLYPSAIGLYFAKLWYYEKLYPYIFAAAALAKVSRAAK